MISPFVIKQKTKKKKLKNYCFLNFPDINVKKKIFF